MPLKLVSRADLARLAKCSKAAVTKALKSRLAAACVGDRVNAAHPIVRAWLATRRGKTAGPARAPTPAKKPKRKAPRAPTAAAATAESGAASPTAARPALPEEEPPPPLEEVDAFIDVLGPLAQKFATSRLFKDWLSGLEGLERYRKQRLDNDERRGRVISRELVEAHVFGVLEATNKRLLGDTPRALAGELFSLARSGSSQEELEGAIRENISSQLEPMKAHVVRALRDVT